MSSWLRSLIAPPVFEDPEKTRLASMTNIMLLPPLVYCFLLGIFLVVTDWLKGAPLVILFSMYMLMFLAHVLARRGRVRFAAWLFMITVWATITYITANLFGGLESPTIDSFMLVIIATGLLLGWKAAITFAGLSLFSIMAMFYTDNLLQTSLLTQTYQLDFHILNLILATGLVLIAVSNINEGFRLARRREQELAENHRKLQDISSSLEQQVVKRSQEIIQQKEFFQALVENSPDAIIILDLDQYIISCNLAFERLFGYSQSEVIGRFIDDLVTNETTRQEAESYTQSVVRGKTIHHEGQRSRKDGSLIDVEIQGVPVIVGGEQIGALALYHDITERVQTERALRESEEKFRDIFDNVSDFLYFHNLAGKFIETNLAWQREFGYSEEELSVLNVKDLIPNRFKLQFEDYMAEIKDNGKAEGLMRVVTKEGDERIIEYNSSLVYNSDGPIGVQGSARDITDRVKAEKALKESEERYQIIYESAPDAYYLTDLRGVFVDGNMAAEELTGYPKEELIGISFLKLKLLSPKQILRAAKLLAINTLGKPTGPDEFLLKRKDGTLVDVEIRTFPVRIKDQSLVLGIARDITKRVEAEKALREQHEFVTNVLESLTHPFYVVDAANYSILMANSATQLGKVSNGQTCYALTHKSDKPCGDNGCPCPLEEVKRTKKPVVTEHLHYGENGEQKAIEVHGYPIFNGRGEVIQIIEYNLDISMRKQAEEALQLTAKVFENTMEGILIMDADYNIIRTNEAFTQITGYEPHEAIGKTPQLLRSGRHDEGFHKEIDESLSKTGKWQGEIWNRRKNGDIYPEWMSLIAVKNDKDEVINYVRVSTDITARKQFENRLEYLATHDPLTKLPNRTLFQDRLSHALAQAKRNEQRLAVLFLDLDDFKLVNDAFGHAQGDRLLQVVAERLKNCLRDSDTVARLGGDEFSFILENIDGKHEVVSVATKINSSLDAPITMGGMEVSISASVGISVFPDNGEDASSLLEKADTAMYLAKQKGKNNYQFSSCCPGTTFW